MKKFFYLLLALPMLLAACEKTPEPTPEPGPDCPDPELYLVSNGVQYFEAAGGEGDIEYRLENAEGQPQATTTADWITDVTVVPENSTVTFFIAENKGEERKAPLTLSYGPISFDVEIVQKAAEAPTGVVFEAAVLEGEYYGDYYTPNTADNFYIWLADKGLDEDGYEQANATYYYIDIYTALYNGDEQIGDFIKIPAGEYTLDTTNSYAVGTIAQEASGIIVTDEYAEYDGFAVYESGKLVVTDNSLTLTVVINGEEHTVTYTGSTAVADCRIPKGEDKVFDAEQALVYYRGDYYNPGVTDNFCLMFSDIGWDEEYFELPNGAYYIFDIYTDIIDGELALPYGTYTIDMNGTMAPFTIDPSYSIYYLLDEEGWDYVEEEYFVDGTITISAEGAVAELTTFSGATHMITFQGAIDNIIDYSEDSEGGDDIYSTLWEDYRCNLDGCYMTYEYYGDWYEVGYDNWMVYIWPESNYGDALQLELISNTCGALEISGEYTIANTLDSFTAYPGWANGTYMEGSWYFNGDLEIGYIEAYAPLKSGNLTISNNGDGTFNLELDAYDDAYNNITASWTGIDQNAATASVKRATLPAKKQGVKHTQRGAKHEVMAPEARTKRTF